MNNIIEEITEIEEEEKNENPLFSFATIAQIYNDGVTLKIDGNNAATEKHYLCDPYTKYKEGDRVLALNYNGTYVVLNKIGSPGGPAEKNSEMTQAVGIDPLTGELFIKPAATSSGSESATTDRLYAGINKAYYAQLNSSREFVPNYSNSGTNFKLGNSSFSWWDAYLDGSMHLGTAAYGKIGFFGATPQARKTLSTTSANQSYTSATSSNYLTILNNLVGILKSYGLFT